MEPLNNSIFYRPDSSYYFFPKKQQQIFKDKRFFFYGQIEHTEKEKKYLAEYRKFLTAKKLSHSPYIDENKIALFLNQKQFKLEDTYKTIKVHDEWRQATLPLQLTPEIEAMLKSGIIYMCGRDYRYRPIVVMNLKLFDEKKTDLIINAFTYFFEELIEKVLLPGQVEHWVTIMDVEGFSLFSLPLGGGKRLLNHLETHYRGRLHKLYLVNSPSAVWLSWKIVKQFLEDSTVEKVDIISDNKIKELYKNANLSQIEKKFQGSQQTRKIFWQKKKIDIDDSYFVSDCCRPGARPVEEILKPGEPYENNHLTKEQYKQRLDKLQKNIVHPDFANAQASSTDLKQQSLPSQKTVENSVTKSSQSYTFNQQPANNPPTVETDKKLNSKTSVVEVAELPVSSTSSQKQPQQRQNFEDASSINQAVPKEHTGPLQPKQIQDQTISVNAELPPIKEATVGESGTVTATLHKTQSNPHHNNNQNGMTSSFKKQDYVVKVNAPGDKSSTAPQQQKIESTSSVHTEQLIQQNMEAIGANVIARQVKQSQTDIESQSYA